MSRRRAGGSSRDDEWIHRREVYEEVKDLHAGNIALRERNLKLGRELARLFKENIRLEKDLGSLESGEDWNAIKEELLLQRRLLYNRFLPSLKIHFLILTGLVLCVNTTSHLVLLRKWSLRPMSYNIFHTKMKRSSMTLAIPFSS
ncbi:unnamed protein product [Lepeophtheirus salmonis]|uniref:(salmon louse) hypothetical protein n=1 Tax=Lepeophtheirus salmonis TaxID=72036 RepID=A0A7R8CME3_LEPSM|nr:unnamed protein product [Lepeophtheirus salmonis]CAF2864805.1 unnamed protein product [Lepeophtheirus salmonis]